MVLSFFAKQDDRNCRRVACYKLTIIIIIIIAVDPYIHALVYCRVVEESCSAVGECCSAGPGRGHAEVHYTPDIEDWDEEDPDDDLDI